jgi:hypothetical protein
MSIRDFAEVLQRNFLVALLLIALTLFAAARVRTNPPIYQARTVVTLLAPPTSFPRNSYASFTPDLTVMAEVTTRDMSSDQGRARVRRSGGTGDYQVILANRGNQELPIHDQPYLTVMASSPDPVRARQTLQAVLDIMHADLTARQVAEGATPSSLISGKLTTITSRPEAQTGRPTRTLAAITILGLLGIMYGTLLADRYRSRLRRRRSGLSHGHQHVLPEVPT